MLEVHPNKHILIGPYKNDKKEGRFIKFSAETGYVEEINFKGDAKEGDYELVRLDGSSRKIKSFVANQKHGRMMQIPARHEKDREVKYTNYYKNMPILKTKDRFTDYSVVKELGEIGIEHYYLVQKKSATYAKSE